MMSLFAAYTDGFCEPLCSSLVKTRTCAVTVDRLPPRCLGKPLYTSERNHTFRRLLHPPVNFCAERYTAVWCSALFLTRFMYGRGEEPPQLTPHCFRNGPKA